MSVLSFDHTSQSANVVRRVNRYFVDVGSKRTPVPWNLADREHLIVRDCRYFGKVLQAMERRLTDPTPLTVYLTQDVERLPSYGDDVVAVVFGDEWSRVPAYANRVRATFKGYGTRLHLGPDPLRHPSFLNTLAGVHFLRTSAIRMAGTAKYRLRRESGAPRSGTRRPVYGIPSGYLNQLDLPIRPIAERGIDVGFMGSVVHSASHARALRGRIGTPKSVSRSQMAREVEALRRARPDLGVQLGVTASFAEGNLADPRTYSENLMNTKICLVPRGTTWETYRFYEAMRYGCVVLGEYLPPLWYLEGSPAIEVRDWRDLGQHVEALVSNPTIMDAKHRDALSWWERTCSEEAVGAFMASKLNLRLGTTC